MTTHVPKNIYTQKVGVELSFSVKCSSYPLKHDNSQAFQEMPVLGSSASSRVMPTPGEAPHWDDKARPQTLSDTGLWNLGNASYKYGSRTGMSRLPAE